MNLPVGFRRVCSEASGTFPGNLRFSDLLSAGTARYEALHGTPSLPPLLLYLSRNRVLRHQYIKLSMSHPDVDGRSPSSGRVLGRVGAGVHPVRAAVRGAAVLHGQQHALGGPAADHEDAPLHPAPPLGQRQGPAPADAREGMHALRNTLPLCL